MTDLISSDWAELDANNTNPSPNGIQGSAPPSQVAPVVRAIRGALKRFYVQANATITSTGSATAYVLTYGQAPSPGYSKGIIYRWFAHADNTGPATIDINGLGAKQILSLSGAPLTAGMIKTGKVIETVFNGTSFEMLGVGDGAGLTNLNASALTLGTVADARLPSTMSSKTISGSLTTRIGSSGYATVNGGDATYAGHFAVHMPDGTRTCYIGNSTVANKAISFAAENGYHFRFEGPDPVVNGSKIWHAGNMGHSSGLNADMTDGYHVHEGSSVSTIVARNASGNIVARDGVFARSATTGYAVFGLNGTASIGSDNGSRLLTSSSLLVQGDLSVNGGFSGNDISSWNGSIVNRQVNSGANAVYWHQNASGTPRVATYFGPEENLTWNLYNSSGTFVRNATFKVSNGQFYVNGYLETNGNVYGNNLHASGNVIVGNAARLQSDGNVIFAGGMASTHGASLFDALNARVKNDGGTYSINITGRAGRAYPSRVGGGDMNFNWAGQGGQPTWLWGGEDGTTMYVYNPSNFSVNYANSAGTAGSAPANGGTSTNSNQLGGVGPNGYAKFYSGSVHNETGLPIGHTIIVYIGGSANRNRNTLITPSISSVDTAFYRMEGITGAGAQLEGTWRCRGHIGTEYVMAQRIA